MAFGQGQVELCYVDTIILLGIFPGTAKDYPWAEESETRQDPHDFVITYGGMMWVQYQEKALIPLWIDMGYADQAKVSLTTPSI